MHFLLSGCGNDTFGSNCQSACHCLNGSCDSVTGLCETNVCAIGWEGVTCSNYRAGN